MNCCTVLAAILQKFRQRRVIVSYSTTQIHYVDIVKEWIETMGGHVDFLPPKAIENAQSVFEERAREADVAISIVGANESKAVEHEYITLRNTHPERHILLLQDGRQFQPFTPGTRHQFKFNGHSGGFEVLAFDVIKLLKKWWD